MVRSISPSLSASGNFGTLPCADLSYGRLTRTSFQPSLELNLTQARTDSTVHHLMEDSARLSTFASILAGTGASQLARAGILSLGAQATGWSARAVQAAGTLGGLSAEAVVFELINRCQIGLIGPIRPINCWTWNGEGGLRQGFLTSGITFGTLRGVRIIAPGQNIVLQHTAQSSAMVAGHNIAGAWGVISRPEGSLADQLFEAEGMNLHLSAGMAAFHFWAPGLRAWERGLDLSNRFQGGAAPRSPAGSMEGGRPQLTGNHAGLPLRNALHSWAFETPGPLPRPTSHPVERVPESSAGPLRAGEKGLVFSLGGAAATFREDVPRSEENDALPSTQQAQRLTERFSPALASGGSPHYGPSILRAVLQIPTSIPHFHERLLTAFAASDRRGSWGQRLTALALQEVFSARSLRTATGGMDYALLQLMASQAIGEYDPARRNGALGELLDAMEEGLTPDRLTRMLVSSSFGRGLSLPEGPIYPAGFWEPHRSLASQAWRGYAEENVIALRNFIYQNARSDPARAARIIRLFGEARTSGRYDPEEIDQALTNAREHPLGRIILQRLVHVLAVEDDPSKVRELAEWGQERDDTLSHISNLRNSGLNPESIARSINGSHHTAYVNDLRLARKIVSVFWEVEPYLRDPRQRLENREQLNEAMDSFLNSRRPLTPEALWNLMETNGDSQAPSLRRAHEARLFRIEIVSGEEFNRIVSRWGKVENCLLTFFQQGENGAPDRIVIRELPDLQLLSPEQGRQELTNRLTGLVHEAEHWRHFSGNFWGVEQGSEAIPLRSISRHDRIVSEMMAFLEMQRFRNKNLEADTWEIGRRLGINLPLFYRNYNDISYFGKTNDRLAREWMGG